jgi:hypothetical protein
MSYEFRRQWRVLVRKTGEEFTTICTYRSSDFTDDGLLIPLYPIELQGVDDGASPQEQPKQPA